MEFGFEIEIRPFRGLQERHNFEAAITRDLSTILVDEWYMLNRPNRYHFTLAHELGHKVLHGGFISSLDICDKPHWQQVVMSISPSDFGRLELQANIFAGMLLVPIRQLRESCEEARWVAEEHGIDLFSMGAFAVSQVAGWIAKSYKVSTEVVERRIADEGFVGQ